MDLPGGYGGEELIILLPETDLVTALEVAERMCAAIAVAPMKVSGQEINATVSIAVAAKNENNVDLETLIAGADQAMPCTLQSTRGGSACQSVNKQITAAGLRMRCATNANAKLLARSKSHHPPAVCYHRKHLIPGVWIEETQEL